MVDAKKVIRFYTAFLLLLCCICHIDGFNTARKAFIRRPPTNGDCFKSFMYSKRRCTDKCDDTCCLPGCRAVSLPQRKCLCIADFTNRYKTKWLHMLKKTINSMGRNLFARN